MLRLIRTAVTLLLVFTLLTGVAYPLMVTGVAALFLPRQAHGTLIADGNRVVGSELIGQPFDDAKYFWGRPSATAPVAYNAMSGSGSNLGPTNPALTDAVRQRIQRLQMADPENRTPVPIDLVTASASGLDPHISPAAAEYQATRVARVRGLSVEQVRNLIAAHREGPTFGIFGQPRVHVLRLNHSLDQSQGTRP